MPRQGPLRRNASFASRRSAEFAIIKPGQAAIFAPGRLKRVGDITIPLTGNEAWQRDAYGFAEVIGELGYLIELTSDAIASCTIRPQQRAPENELGWVDTENAEVNGAWEAFIGPQGGQNELIKRAAEHLYTAGESYLLGTPLKNELTNQDEGIVWEFLSTEELKPSGTKIQRVGETGSGRVDLPDDVYVARLWQPDPRFYARAYSAVKRVLPICREIVLLTQVVDAIAKGRLNAGIYYLPDEFSFGPFDETENDGSDTDEIDEFSEEWIEQITTPVEQRDSAASLVPLLMRGPAMIDGKPAKDLMGLVDLARGLDELYQSLRQEALGRLSSGMDAPPEIIGGKGGLNHWCVSDDHEVLTQDRGWITQDALSVGDMVRTLNHETGLSEWQPVLDIYRSEVRDEPMVSIEGDRHSSLTTPNHRWPTLHGRSGSRERIWTTSEQLNGLDSLVVAAPSADQPTEQKWSDGMVELAAWLWTEGNIRFRDGRLSPQVTIWQSNEVNPDNVARIRRSCALVFGDASKSLGTGSKRVSEPKWVEEVRPDRPRMTEFRFNSAAADILVGLFVDPERKVLDCDFISEMTAAQIELFIDASVRADGSVLPGGTIHLAQADAGRIAPLELAATLSGRSTNVYPLISGMTMLSISAKTTFGVAGKRIVDSTFTGTIWCPVTPNKSWLARRDGKTFYTGNTGYSIDADFIDKHIVPKGQKIAEFLTAAYLRPMLIEFEGMSEEQASLYRLHFDANVLTSRTDTGPAARAAYDRIALSEAAYLRANGFDVSDVPSEEERKQRTLERLMFEEPILWGTRVLGELYPDLADIFTPDDLTSPGNEVRSQRGPNSRKRGQGPSQGDGGTEEDIPDSDTGQGVPEARGPSVPGGNEESALVERLQTAADAALKRAIERASNRVISRLNGTDLPVKEKVRQKGKYEILSILSADDYKHLQLQKEDLMRDAWSNLETDATAWVRQHFIAAGENAFVAEGRAKASVEYLTTVLTAHMATAFTNPIPTGLNGLRVPTEFVVRSLEKAHEVDVDPYQSNG